MYDEIDYSGQGIVKIASIFVYAIMMLLFLFVALGIPPESTYIEDVNLLFILVMEPFAAVVLGSILGFITKYRVRISTDGLVFNDETRRLSEFGSAYFEGSETSIKLGGYLPSGCAWIIFIASVPTSLDLILVFTTPFIAGIVFTVACGFLYYVGYRLTKSAAPIRTHMVKNPIYQRLTKFISVDQALDTFKQCQYSDHLIVKYRHAKGEILNLIDDVHVFIITTTDPVLEIEVTLENIAKIGLELTATFEERIASQKEETIKVDGTDAILTVKDTGMNTLVSISYDMNRFSERLALGSAKKNCNLLEALLHELKQHISELTIKDRDPLYG